MTLYIHTFIYSPIFLSYIVLQGCWKLSQHLEPKTGKHPGWMLSPSQD